MFSGWKDRSRVFRCRTLKPRFPGEAGVSDRQERVPGFGQGRYSAATIYCAGAGGLNSEVLEGAVRKGIGTAKVCDGDRIEKSNLNRQHFFSRDLGRNKAVCLCRNMVKHGYMGTTLIAHPVDLQDAVAEGRDLGGDVYLFGVDNNDTRLFGSDMCAELGKPGLFYGVTEDAGMGYVFVQEAGGPTFRSVLPLLGQSAGGRKRCAPAGAVKDILKVVAGFALYALDTLVTDRRRNWNYRAVWLSGFAPDIARRIPSDAKDMGPDLWEGM